MCPPVLFSQSERRTRLVLALLLVGLTAVAYIPAMNGGFVWDDDDYVQDNLTLADAHQARGESAATMRHYRRALKPEPDRVETYLKLGNALLGQNAVAEAIDHYRRALQPKPTYR